MKATYYLVSRPADLRNFSCQSDRDYFSKPVGVLWLHSDVATRMPYVRDSVRGHEYPCLRSNLKTSYALTNKQRTLVGIN